jgi:aminomethyltransferase
VDEAAYRSAHQLAIAVRRELGVLRFTGETRLDLVDRMSTQKVCDLKAGQGAATVLTTDIGRIIDRLLLCAGDQAVTCLTGEGHAEAVARYLRRHVFFKDDFQVEEPGAAVVAVYGAQAVPLLERVLGAPADLPLHHGRPAELNGCHVLVQRTDPIAGDGAFLICPPAELDRVWAALAGAGIQPAGEADFDYLRIESGQPRFGRELTLDYIPLETGLWADVSFNKGCYTGQEIIARMESRGRLAKRLVRLRPEAPLAPGAELSASGRPAGVITSAADGPAGPLALGYVKTALLAEGAPLLAAGQTGVAVLPDEDGPR